MSSSAASKRRVTPPPGRPPAPPAVDERLVMPETRFEIIDGEVLPVSPSNEPHGSRHSKISALLEAHVVTGYDVAVDMLTRTALRGDMAPDASVFPTARDKATGGRQIEELAFEVLDTETLPHAAKKARALVARGVRRVFAVDVERRRGLEWSRQTDAWEILPGGGAIADPVFAAPLPLQPLVDAVKADDAMAHALLAKKNPVLEAALREREARGMLAGKVAAVLGVLNGRGLRVSKKAAARIRAVTDEPTIDRWLARVATVETADELFGP
jgi:Uma2 family endonuclease